MADTVRTDYLKDALSSFRAYKKLADKGIAQLKDDEFFVKIDEEANSVGVIMKHLAGNMISRWTDFLTSDGEKPNRNRDSEFVLDPQTSKEDVIAYWEKGWQCLFAALDPLRPEDLERTVLIRGENHAVVQAINRQLMHYAYHIGQIVFLAKHFRSAEWNSLSIPKNRSAEFNAYLGQAPREADRERQFEAAAEFGKAQKAKDK